MRRPAITNEPSSLPDAAPKVPNSAVVSSGIGIISILSVSSLAAMGFAFWFGLPGIILGIVAIVRIRRRPHRWRGMGYAIVGIVLSALGFGLASLVVVTAALEARVRKHATRTRSDIQAVSISLEAYHAANGAYPTLAGLTTPVAYYTDPIPIDPFTKKPYVYHLDSRGEGEN